MSVQFLLPLLYVIPVPGPNWALKVVGGQPYSHGALVLFWGVGCLGQDQCAMGLSGLFHQAWPVLWLADVWH